MALLALDLGTKTGWAFGNAGSVVSGTQDFKPSRFESSAMRFVKFNKFLAGLHTNGPIEHIAYEEVRRHAGTDAAHVYGGFLGHLLVFAEIQGIPAEAYPVGTIKKFWTGSGNASKQLMIDGAAARGHIVEDDNQADALAIFYMMTGMGALE